MTDLESSHEVTVDDVLDRYIQRVFAPSDALLSELLAEAERAGFPIIAIYPHEAKIVQVLLRSIQARKVVEVGTCFGYGAIWLARALPSTGTLYTIEKNPEFQALARKYVERAGLSDRVEFRLGEAVQVFPELTGEAIDAVFIDANWDEYPAYLEWALSVLRPGGLIISHNAHFFGFVVLDPNSDDFAGDLARLSDEAAASYEARDAAGKAEFLRALRAIRNFNQQLASDPRLTSVLIPTTEGLSVAVVNHQDASHG